MSTVKKYPLLRNGCNTDVSKRYDQAWSKARQLAEILKTSFFAQKVILFGSLLHKSSFDSTSDIDLAVSGIPDHKFYEAVGSLMQVAAPFEIDLLDIEDCRESIKKIIESEGVAL